MNPSVLAFIPGVPGGFELVIIAGIVLLLFGKRLPGVMRSLGQSIVEFKKGVKDIDADNDKQQTSESITGGKSDADG